MTPTLGTRPVSSVGLATNWRRSTIDNQTHTDWSFDRQRFLYGRLSICFSSCIFHSCIFHPCCLLLLLPLLHFPLPHFQRPVLCLRSGHTAYCHASVIDLDRPAALLSYVALHSHTRWTLTFDLDSTHDLDF